MPFAKSREPAYRAVRAIALCAIMFAATLAAGCSSSGSTPEGRGPSGAATANVDAAKAAIAPFVGHPPEFPVGVPLSKPLPAGTKFAYLQCGASACALIAKLVQAAVEELGGTLTVVSSGTTASSAQAAVSSVLALKPAAVVALGIEPALYGGGLKRLSDAGIKVVTVSIAEETEKYGITFNYLGLPAYEQVGRLFADWVIVNKGPQADVVFYSVPELSFSTPMTTAFVDELGKNCPSCKVRLVSVGIATLGTTAPRTIVTDLQAHPSTNTLLSSTGQLVSGLPAALSAAGISVTTMTYSPQAGALQDIKDGRLTAGLAVDYPVSTFTAVDIAARLVLGEAPTPVEQAGGVPVQFLAKQDITFDPSNGWTGYPDYAQRFAKLWHPGT